MDDQEALEFGFSKMSVESVEEMLEKKYYQLSNDKI